MDIKKLLKPHTVAIVGASEKMGMGRGTCTNIIEFQDDKSNVYFVNPKCDELFGQKCYRSLSDIPVDIDLVVVCTGRAHVLNVLREAATKKCAAAVVYASGYAEVCDEEGLLYEHELKQLAQELNIAVMGPNCGGYINFADSVFAFAFEGEYAGKKGGVGLVSQSGQFCIDMLNSKDLRFSYAISAGNSGIVEMEDYIMFLVDDPDTKVIALYLEGIKNACKLEVALRKAAQTRKPIVVLKAGRSPQGAANAASHTGSLAGDDAAYDAVFKKFGVVRADDLQDLRSTTMLFSVISHIPKRANFGAMCMSGGETGICADSGYMKGINYPPISESTCNKMRKLIPFYATPRNPQDLTVTLSYDAELFAEGIATFVNDEAIDIGVLGYTITDKRPTEPEFIMFEGIKLANERVGEKPLVIVPFVESTRYAEFADKFLELGIPILAAPQYAFVALRHLADFIEYEPTSKELSLSISEKKATGKKTSLSEYESRKYLKDNGVDVYLGAIARDEEDTVSIAEKTGYPIVMKVDSPDILHKTDAGCVMLNVANADEVRKKYREIMKNAYAWSEHAHVNGVLIQKMFSDFTEVIIGLKRDQQLGQMLLVGIGGVFVEVFRDVSLCPAPISRDEARSMLMSLKSYKLLSGYRGKRPCDVEKLIDLMLQISRLAQEKADSICELDLNPVFVFENGKGVALGDALLVTD